MNRPGSASRDQPTTSTINPFAMKQVPLDADESDEDVCTYEFPGRGRLVLRTIHGEICIDIRANDVNAFVFTPGPVELESRVDHLLLPATKRTS